MKRFLGFLLLILPFGIFANEIPVYRIGMILPLSGKNAQIGKQVKDGMEVFLKFILEADGYKEYKIKTTLFDTQSKKENADKILKYLNKHSKEYFALAGGLEEKTIDQLIGLSKKKSIPYLFPLRSRFKERNSKYYFPILPSYYHVFKFMMDFFTEKKMSFKIIYDDSTKEDVFLLISSDKLLEANDPNLDKKLGEVSILYVADDKVEEVIKKIASKSMNFVNYHQINRIFTSKNPSLWEGTVFLSWVKQENDSAVAFFKKEFKKYKKQEANNANMLGWMLSDLIYEVISKATDEKGDKIEREDFFKHLETFGGASGYNQGCGYKIFYSPFTLSQPKSRAGISGIYFMKYQKGEFVIISDFYSFFDNGKKAAVSNKKEKIIKKENKKPIKDVKKEDEKALE